MIKVRWNTPGIGSVSCSARDYGYGKTSHAYDIKSIIIYGVPNAVDISKFYISGTYAPNCDQFSSARPINLPEYYGASYDWVVPSGAVENDRSKYNLNIKGFNVLKGLQTVAYTITPANGCGAQIRKEYSFNVQPKLAGPLLDNNTSQPITDASGTIIKGLIPNASGQFSLRLQNSINSANYIWMLPAFYNDYGNYLLYTPFTNTGQISGTLPSNALTDFSGFVISNGFCGPQSYPFTIKARRNLSVPATIESCNCTVDIPVNNPNGDQIYSAWEQSGNGGTVVIADNNRVIFTAPSNGSGGCKPGTYTVGMSIQNVSGNKTTNITIGGNTAKWLSGTLSDVRVDAATNIVYAQSKIFFGGRDGKLYYYEFDKGLNKWAPVVYSASIRNVKNVPGSFLDMGVNWGNSVELFYPANDGFLYKAVNRSAGVQLSGTDNNTGILHVDQGSSDHYGELLFRSVEAGVSSIKNVTAGSVSAKSTGITNVDNSALLGYENNIYFIRGQELYRASYAVPATQVKISGVFKLHPKTSYGLDNDGKLYVCEQSGKILRINLSTLVIETVVDIAGFCEGEFTINPKANNTYNAPVIYAKHKVSGQPNYTMWKAYPAFGSIPFIAEPATSSTFDYVAHSPIYAYPHVYYVAETTPEGVNSTWNLYFKENCTPAIFRKGLEETEEGTAKAEMSLAVYPNPMTSHLSIEASGAEKGNLKNSFGETVTQFGFEAGKANINTEQLAPGIYFLEIYAGDNLLATKKLVK